MKIMSLETENVKRVKAIRIEPNGHGVRLYGDNEEGKTSVLDSIRFALCGGAAIKDTPRPIRDGETTAKVLLTLGEDDGSEAQLIIKRNWTAKDTYLTVEDADGKRMRSPQSILDDLVGRFVDPSAFGELSASDQRAIILDLAGLTAEVAEIDARTKKTFDERTLTGREVTRLQGALASMDTPADDVPTERVSMAALTVKMEEAAKTNRQNDETRANCRRLTIAANEAREKSNAASDVVAQLKLDVAQAVLTREARRKNYDEATMRSSNANEKAAALVDADISAITTEMATVETKNAAIDAAAKYRETAATLATRQRDYDEGTTALTGYQGRKDGLLAEARLPVPGLGVDDTGVTHDGMPLSQCSGSRRIRVGAAVGMALQPKVKVLLIDEASRLDEKRFAMLLDLCDEKGYQPWTVRLSDDKPGAVHIVDGEVAREAIAADV